MATTEIRAQMMCAKTRRSYAHSVSALYFESDGAQQTSMSNLFSKQTKQYY